MIAVQGRDIDIFYLSQPAIPDHFIPCGIQRLFDILLRDLHFCIIFLILFPQCVQTVRILRRRSLAQYRDPPLEQTPQIPGSDPPLH